MKNMKFQSHAYYQIALLYDIRNDDKNFDKYLKLSGFPVEEIIDHCF